jgi:probable rRNA maturation factor
MPNSPAKRPIDVRIFPAFRSPVKAAWAKRVLAAALEAGDPGGTAGASIVVADDDTLLDLNARFRGLDEVTDVLSFGEDGQGPAFPTVPGTEASHGEVILSYPLAMRQAREHNVATEQEVALLMVHGVLHLMGHDHAEPGEEAIMRSLEQQVLEQLADDGLLPAGVAG